MILGQVIIESMMNMDIFEYGDNEINYLKKKDKKLGLAIDRIGKIERVVIPDLFAALINSIVAQQISSKAAATVWGRLCVILGDITPVSITNASLEDIQKCGMSVRKASYIKIIGDAVSCGELNISEFPNMSDGEITQRLSALHGIGVWTAEMLLIFSMQRPNVVSWGDLAIRRGMCNLYGHKKLDRVKFEKYKKRYSPYGSVASLYLWAVSVEE